MHLIPSAMINGALFGLVALGAIVSVQADLLGSLYHGSRETGAIMANFVLGAGLMGLIAVPLYAARRQSRTAAWIKAEQKKLAETAQAARFDPLTGLLTRRCFADRVADIGRRVGPNGTLALLVIDIDSFKAVTEHYNHDIGDQVLEVLAHRIANAAGADAQAFYLGCDAFALLSDEAALRRPSSDIAGDVITALRHPVQIGALAVSVTASIGVATGGGGSTVTELMRQAKIALQTAKRNGGGTVQVFDAALDRHMRKACALQGDLLHGLQSGQFHTVFEPCFDLQSNCLIGATARPRWRHPQLGYVAPATFMDLAEKGGVSDCLFHVVLGQACAAAKDWPRSITLRIGIRPTQPSDARLADRVLATLQDNGLAPSQLELLIAQQDVLDDLQRAADLLGPLSQAGVRIAVGGLGTGLSSLSILTQMSCQNIMLDRSLATQLQTDPVRRAMVAAVIRMGHDLGTTVTAAGIERAEDLAVLKNHLPLMGQGPLLGRPRPADAMLALIRTRMQAPAARPARIISLRSAGTG